MIVAGLARRTQRLSLSVSQEVLCKVLLQHSLEVKTRMPQEDPPIKGIIELTVVRPLLGVLHNH